MNAPERIYLQVEGEEWDALPEEVESPDVTWCSDRIHKSDPEYLRSDIHEREMKEAFYAGVDYADSIPAEMDLHGRDVHFDEWVKRRENDTQTIQSHWLRGYGNISW